MRRLLNPRAAGLLVGLGLCSSAALAQDRPTLDANQSPLGELFPKIHQAWAPVSGTLLRRVYNRVPHPENAIIRTPDTLAKFLGDPERVMSLLQPPVTSDPRGRQVTGVPPLQLGPGQCMLIGVHLGSQGSEGYDVEITKIERVAMHPKVRIHYRIIPKAGTTPEAPGGVNAPPTLVVPGAPGTRATNGFQSSAPAHVVKIPWLNDPPETFQFIEDTLQLRFGGMEAIALSVSGGELEDVDARINQLGVVWVKGKEEPVGKALVSELVALGQALRTAQPLELMRQYGTTPVAPPESGALRSNVQFKLFTWHGPGNPQEISGSWDTVRPRLQPLRDVLEAILLRIQGKIRPEDLARLQGRLGLNQLELVVNPVRLTQPNGGESVEVLPGLRVRVNKLGVVQAGEAKGTLTEPEWELLVRVVEKTGPMTLPEFLAPSTEMDAATGVMPSATQRKFKLELLSQEGELKHVGGSLYGGAPEDRARIQAIKQALELIASRVERRPAEIAGTVNVEGENVTITWPLVGFTYKLDPVEGDPQTDAARLKLKEWPGRWVEVRAIARANTAESGDAVVSRIMYPQRGEITGVHRGGAITWQEPGLSPDPLTIRIVGDRSARLLAGLDGWVKIDAYIFYDERMRPSEAFAEALQVVASRRIPWRLREPNNVEEDGVIKLYQQPDRGSGSAGIIHVPKDGAEYYWVTDRRNGFSFIPSMRGWADESKTRLFHMDENPKDVSGRGRVGGIDVLEATLNALGNAAGGTGR